MLLLQHQQKMMMTNGTSPCCIATLLLTLVMCITDYNEKMRTIFILFAVTFVGKSFVCAWQAALPPLHPVHENLKPELNHGCNRKSTDGYGVFGPDDCLDYEGFYPTEHEFLGGLADGYFKDREISDLRPDHWWNDRYYDQYGCPNGGYLKYEFREWAMTGFDQSYPPLVDTAVAGKYWPHPPHSVTASCEPGKPIWTPSAGWPRVVTFKSTRDDTGVHVGPKEDIPDMDGESLVGVKLETIDGNDEMPCWNSITKKQDKIMAAFCSSVTARDSTWWKLKIDGNDVCNMTEVFDNTTVKCTNAGRRYPRGQQGLSNPARAALDGGCDKNGRWMNATCDHRGFHCYDEDQSTHPGSSCTCLDVNVRFLCFWTMREAPIVDDPGAVYDAVIITVVVLIMLVVTLLCVIKFIFNLKEDPQDYQKMLEKVAAADAEAEGPGETIVDDNYLNIGL